MTIQLGPDYIRAMAPYQGGKPISEVAREYGLDPHTIIKLASNENPLGMSDAARVAIVAAVQDIPLYPDSHTYAFRHALAQYYGVPAAWITPGNGSNELLILAAQALVAPHQAIVYSQYSFAIYPLAAQAIDARSIVVPAKNFGNDFDALLAAITPDTRLVFVANPNNPTGTFDGGAALLNFLERVPPQVVVVLDEAYTEYLAPELRYNAFEWVVRFPNLLVLRTFSKAYGLAGLRVGFGVAQPQITDLLNRLRQPFNSNHLAQAAAIAALADHEFVAQTQAVNTAGYAQLTQAFDALGLPYVPSCANFVLFKVGEEDNAGTRVAQALLARGVIVRTVGNYGLPQWLRVSIGTAAQNAGFLAALKDVLQ